MRQCQRRPPLEAGAERDHGGGAHKQIIGRLENKTSSILAECIELSIVETHNLERFRSAPPFSPSIATSPRKRSTWKRKDGSLCRRILTIDQSGAQHWRLSEWAASR